MNRERTLWLAIGLLLTSLACLVLGVSALAGFASVNAANAANHGARVGSVYQQQSSGAAYSAAMQKNYGTSIR